MNRAEILTTDPRHVNLHFDQWDLCFKSVVRYFIFTVLMYLMCVYVWYCNWFKWNYWYVNMKMWLRILWLVYIMKQRYVVKCCKVFLGQEIPLVMCFTRVCLDSQYCSIFCEAILNSTNYSYSRRGEWWGGESSRRFCHKDGSIILMIVKEINLVCHSSVEQIIISLQVYSSTSLT